MKRFKDEGPFLSDGGVSPPHGGSESSRESVGVNETSQIAYFPAPIPILEAAPDEE